MKCDRCQTEVEAEDVREHGGRTLCEDCYMDVLSPAKSCDPWATYTSSRLGDQTLTPVQDQIISLIKDKRSVPPGELRAATGLDQGGLEREIATLRHVELVRGHRNEDGTVVLRAFNDRD
jgi:hypothetical protein